MVVRKVIKSLALTIFVFGFAGWVYIALIALVHPESLSWQVTHFTPWLREDTFGVICFIASFIAFFVWNLLKEERKD